MKEKPLVSIVVPVYNVEKYLSRCYESIASQSYSNWEAVLVDDGSTDNSGKMCDEIALVDPRIKVIHKQNEGLGLTRNCGVKNSSGEYVFFLDSDDYIESDAIESLVESIIDEECDLAIGNFYYQEEIVEYPIPIGVYSGNEIEAELIPRIIGSEPGKTDQLTPSSCGNLYKKALFIDHYLWFPSERKLIWEDLAFNFQYMRNCNRIFLSDKPVYHYCFNEASLTHKYDPNKLEKVMLMYKYMRNQIEKTGLIIKTENRLNNNFVGHIRTCLKLEAFYDKENGIAKTIKRITEMCCREDVQSVIMSIDTNTYNRSQRILDHFIKSKNGFVVYLLCKAQNRKKKIE